MSDEPAPVPPSLRPVDGRGAGASEGGGDETRAVLREFGGNRVAMAAEIGRLRVMLQDALFELSRVAAGSGTVLTTTSQPCLSPPAPARPFGFGPRSGPTD